MISEKGFMRKKKIYEIASINFTKTACTNW